LHANRNPVGVMRMRMRVMTDSNFNRWCEELLATYTRRNQQAVARHLESLRSTLSRQGNHAVQTMFGGSMRRGTDVAGLSDVDALLIVNESSLRNRSPSDVIEHVREIVQRQHPSNTVRAGRLAVTITYSDGTEIQLLPALRTSSGGIRIAELGSTGWSSVVRPERFAEELSAVNQATDGRATPVIKLAKSIADCQITNQTRKITGYHMEALAIDAFRNYRGATNPQAMLDHLLSHSMTAVMKPIADSTGQSRNVDDYLGQGKSRRREGARTHFGQMRGKVRGCVTRAQFNALFCL